MSDNFKQIQFKLAQWLRDDNATADFPQVESRRLAIYRRLIRNNISQFLSNGFPVVQATLGAERWQALVAGFIATHASKSPLFSDIGSEFVDFLAGVDLAQRDLPAWLFELAHYERIEVEVKFAHFDETLAAVETLNDDTVLYLNSTAMIGVYQYPVAKIDKDHQPDAALDEPYIVLVYQLPDTGTVKFLQLNPLTAHTLSLLQAQPRNFTALCEALLMQFPEQDPQQLAAGLFRLVDDFCERFVLFMKP
ncbi:DNA-binding domain-containing protein [Pseudidiomarina insulisalsae]|uniref:Uncharacterized protein n=1 Tax=Pseudidiomarina insulisalsae TaxID=575789 RepID=A0A432YF19_9GAMM|nr:putative DNA-binding domain-containing protein [Pseudidiomarina insulisalsae]RUO59505.1 hypothetical protein CWI71_08795 [Pseudidiomarina insulisalsae]